MAVEQVLEQTAEMFSQIPDEITSAESNRL